MVSATPVGMAMFRSLPDGREKRESITDQRRFQRKMDLVLSASFAHLSAGEILMRT